MAKNLTTHRFKLHHVRQFIESISERANTEYYVFAGHPVDYSDPDNAPSLIDCTQSLHQRIYDHMTHAKRVTPNDVLPMIRKIIWTSGTVYDQYESNVASSVDELSNKNFYVVNQSGSENNYYVFKCLFNNNGKPSTSPPKRSEVQPEDPYYETSDGYIWKYMYAINPTTYRKFTTDRYIPVVNDTDVSANAVPGQIDVIQIDYSGSLYNNYFLGQIYPGDSSYNGISSNLRLNLPEQDKMDIASIVGNGTTVIVTTSGEHNYTDDMKIQISGAVSISPVSISYDGIYTITVLGPTQFQFDDPSSDPRDEIEIGKTFIYNANAPTVSYADQYYKNCVIKIISGPARGQYRRIISYDGDFRVATLADFNSDTPYPFSASQSDLQYALYQIYPQAIITGDDREESTAVAWAVIDPATANSVSRVEVLDKGKGHFLATANVYAEPNIVRISNPITEATVRPILPPPGGHGKDPAAELYADRVGISVKFSNNENGQISTDNSFDLVGLIKDPLWNKIKINYDSNDLAGSFVDTEEIAILDQTYLSGSAYVYSDSKEIQSSGDFGGVTFNYITDINDQTTAIHYSNTDIVTVTNKNPYIGSGQYIPALCEVSTDNSGNIIGSSITTRGWGFSNTNVDVTIANSIGGFIRSMGNTGIYEKVIISDGYSYANGEIISVTTTTGNYEQAKAKITVGTQGEITAIDILNTGKNYLKNGISYIDVDTNGSGFTNGQSITIPAPVYDGISSGDTAILGVNTDGNGNLVSVQIPSNHGNGYDVIPSFASQVNITNIVGDTYGHIVVTTNQAHGYANGENITISGTTSYDGDYIVYNNAYGLNPSKLEVISSLVNVTTPETSGQITSADISFTPFYADIVDIVGDPVQDDLTVQINGDASQLGVTLGQYLKIYGTYYDPGPNNPAAPDDYGTLPAAIVKNISGASNQFITLDYTAGANNTQYNSSYIYHGIISGVIPAIATTNVHIASVDSDFNVFKANGTESFGAKVTEINVESSGTITYAADDKIIVTSNTEAFPSVNATTTSIGLNGSSQLISATLDPTGNKGFTLSAEENPFIANSSGGFIRWFNSTGIVSSYTINDASPNSAIDTVSVSGTMNNYDSTAIQGVNIISGGKGYDSESNNLIQFVLGSGSSAAATFTNNAVGTITNITITNSGTNYLTGFNTLKVIPFVQAHPNGVGAVLEAYLANTLIVTPHANDTDTASGAVVRFTSSAGAITTPLDVVDGGFGYRYPPTFSVPSGAGGDGGAVFTPTLKSDTDVFTNNDKVISVAYGDEAINSSANVTVSVANYINIIDIENSGTPFYTTALPLTYVSNTSSNVAYFDQNSIWAPMVSDIQFTDASNLFSDDDIIKIYGDYDFVGGIEADGNGNILTNGLDAIIQNRGYNIPYPNDLVIEVLNPGGTDIRRLNTTIVESIAINDGGAGFNNNHILVVDSGTGTSNALFRVITDDTYGTIVGFSPINRGVNQKSGYVNQIRLVNGGGGYANTILVNGATGDYLDFCGGGTNANGHIVTDDNGVIQAIYLTDGGINYNCKPEVRIIDSLSGNPRTSVYDAGSFSQASIEANFTKPHRLRLYTDDTLSRPAFSTQFAIDLDVTMIQSASANVILAYSPQIQTQIGVPASINVVKDHSANIQFLAQTSPIPEITIQGSLTSYSEALDSGDLVYLYTVSSGSGSYIAKADLLEVDSVINSTTFTVNQFPNFSGYAGVSRVRKQANGIVYDQTSGSSITLENVKGSLTPGNTIFGTISKASTIIGSTEYNNVQKSNLNVNQLFMYKGTVSGTFEEDELIYASNTLSGGIGQAYYHSGNSTAIFVTSPTGQFKVTQNYLGYQSGASITINDGPSHKYEGDIVRGSGDVMYTQVIDPISRANNQSETIKILLEF